MKILGTSLTIVSILLAVSAVFAAPFVAPSSSTQAHAIVTKSNNGYCTVKYYKYLRGGGMIVSKTVPCR